MEERMKKVLNFIIVFIFLITFFSGCAKEEIPVSSNDIIDEIEEIKIDPDREEIDAFFNRYVNTSKRPVAVMIDNDDDNARPQSGMDDAYLIYELIVEGGATRFMALFRNVETEKIGPVRSSRHYFLDYAMENDAIYTHFGWSPKAITDISYFNIDKINGVLGEDGYIFWREQKFKGDWHSAYTSIKNINEISEKKNYSVETSHSNSIKFSSDYFDLESENTATNINLKYSGNYSTGYKYNQDKKVYEKYIGNNPHKMQNGKILEFKNIIIELKYDTALGDGTARRNINTVGKGKGYYFTNGLYEEITWQKDKRSSNTIYRKTDGTELIINPGKTIINVFSPSYTLTVN